MLEGVLSKQASAVHRPQRWRVRRCGEGPSSPSRPYAVHRPQRWGIRPNQAGLTLYTGCWWRVRRGGGPVYPSRSQPYTGCWWRVRRAGGARLSKQASAGRRRGVSAEVEVPSYPSRSHPYAGRRSGGSAEVEGPSYPSRPYAVHRLLVEGPQSWGVRLSKQASAVHRLLVEGRQSWGGRPIQAGLTLYTGCWWRVGRAGGPVLSKQALHCTQAAGGGSSDVEDPSIQAGLTLYTGCWWRVGRCGGPVYPSRPQPYAGCWWRVCRAGGAVLPKQASAVHRRRRHRSKPSQGIPG
ncbi:hypothetical protein NDU88_007430 [Pleurodeles waltl]|uniref:Uncharacterized protein n=1 Tax=Pleurodeles waltl TaxID=8319 RepID=A0AAV7SSH9_PLEWA|nr:hypothetical protein NDU88_007430 [Pleurodeles waltl]